MTTTCIPYGCIPWYIGTPVIVLVFVIAYKVDKKFLRCLIAWSAVIALLRVTVLIVSR